MAWPRYGLSLRPLGMASNEKQNRKAGKGTPTKIRTMVRGHLFWGRNTALFGKYEAVKKARVVRYW